jgi:hypothetical protein
MPRIKIETQPPKGETNYKKTNNKKQITNYKKQKKQTPTVSSSVAADCDLSVAVDCDL